MFTIITTVLRHDQRIILLDIPGSIESAQLLHINGHTGRIKSTPALSHPYPSTEPKGQKLALALSAIPPEVLDQQKCLEDLLVSALVACKARLGKEGIPWCLPRVPQDNVEKYDLLDKTMTLSMSHPTSQVPVVLSPTNDGNKFRALSDICHCSIVNPSLSHTMLDVAGKRYVIPARSAFVLSSIESGQHGFSMLAETFDLVIMDPPWTNRSVRRSASYKTHEDQAQDPFVQTLPILNKYLKAEGLVAVWVTNKHAIRAKVVTSLQDLGLRLVTEWTWLKVTDQGEAVTDIRGVWRKPYEALLIFSRVPVNIPQHTIIAVPDVHSRKPSLKHVFAGYLPESYSALEIFARSLTAGWWSWGDQVLKFQDTNEWELR
jgi:N6-adenosine-specific RNA methylase IME4